MYCLSSLGLWYFVMVGPVDSVTVKKVRNWEDLYQMIQYTAEDLYQNDEHEFTSFVLRILFLSSMVSLFLCLLHCNYNSLGMVQTF